MITNSGSLDGQTKAAFLTKETLEVTDQETIIESQDKLSALIKHNAQEKSPLITVKVLL